MWRLFIIVALTSAVLRASSPPYVAAEHDSYLAPTALAASPDAQVLYVACNAAAEVLAVQTESKTVLSRMKVDPFPSGLALSPDGKRLYVTCAGPVSSVCVLDVGTGQVTNRLTAGYDAQSPVVSAEGKTLYVCNRFDNDIAVFDLVDLRLVCRIPVSREPFSAAITPDGKYLLVAQHLHAGRADAEVVAAGVTVVDLRNRAVCKQIALPNGSTLLHQISVSPDGRHAVVAHDLARFHVPTTQIERGWINSSAASILDLAEMKLLNTVLLDNIDSGAATPWAVGWSGEGKDLIITHAGTHEASVIDFPGLLKKLAKLLLRLEPGKPVDYTIASRIASDVPNDLSFLVGWRQRIKLSAKGPRSLVIAGKRAWIAGYFTDTVEELALECQPHAAGSLALGATPQMTIQRWGEFYFNDASICFQGWQACSSCHSHDARVDGLNWDNLNDGIGNPKNGKSLLQAHATPPSMWLAVRTNAYVAVRAGIRNSLFTVQPPEIATAMDEYLKSLKPMPSPRLVNGQLSLAAQRGKKLFASDAVGCAECHKGDLFTDLKRHDAGTVGRFDQPGDRFDTPSLVEVWRTAPYLHDGRAATIREVLTMPALQGKHGNTTGLTPQELDDLAEYVLSL